MDMFDPEDDELDDSPDPELEEILKLSPDDFVAWALEDLDDAEDWELDEDE